MQRIDLDNVTFVGIGAGGKEIKTTDINGVIFNESEGIYYIDNILVKRVWVEF
jgi:hypothetical protein